MVQFVAFLTNTQSIGEEQSRQTKKDVIRSSEVNWSQVGSLSRRSLSSSKLKAVVLLCEDDQVAIKKAAKLK